MLCCLSYRDLKSELLDVSQSDLASSGRLSLELRDEVVMRERRGGYEYGWDGIGCAVGR